MLGVVDDQDLVFDNSLDNGNVTAILPRNITIHSLTISSNACTIDLAGNTLLCQESSTFSGGKIDTEGSAYSQLWCEGASDTWTGTQFYDVTNGNGDTGKLWWDESTSVTFGTSFGTTKLDTELEISCADAECTTTVGPSMGKGNITIDASTIVVCNPANDPYTQTWSADSTSPGKVTVKGTLKIGATGSSCGVNIPMTIEIPSGATTAQVTQYEKSAFKVRSVTQSDGTWLCYTNDYHHDANDDGSTELTCTNGDYTCGSGALFQITSTTSGNPQPSSELEFWSDYYFTVSGGTVDVNSGGVGCLFNIDHYIGTGGFWNMTSGYVKVGFQATSGTTWKEDSIFCNYVAAFSGTFNVEVQGSTNLDQNVDTSSNPLFKAYGKTTGYTPPTGLSFVDGSSLYSLQDTYGGSPWSEILYLKKK